ncbi:hypothetical protein Tco_0340414 [Tanacetum coccineum]
MFEVPNAFKCERPRISEPRFASQVDEKNVLSKPVTPYYLPNVREYAPAKPHHVNAPSSSKNSKKESYSSNDMAHNYFLEEARKKTQDRNWNLKPREMPSARTHHTPNACTPKPRSNNQTFRNWPASKSSNVKLNVVQKADHSRNPSSCSDSKHLGFKEVKCDEQEQMASADNTSGPAPQRKESPPPRVVSLDPVVVTAPRAVDLVDSPSSTTIDQDVPSASTSPTNQEIQS